MIIKKLELNNFQVIKDFNADFEGNVYLVTGENEMGKSTILKAIGALLTGDRDAVLRNGEDKGFAKMIVGDDGEEYNVELRFTKANPRGTLTIKRKATGERTNNISMLQHIFGYTDYDAVEFSRMSETAEGRRRQIEIVKSLFPEDARKKIAEIDDALTNFRAERMDINRELKKIEAAVEMAGRELAPGDTERYTAPKDITALIEEQRTNAELIEKAKTVRNARMQRIKQLDQITEREDAAREYYEGVLTDIEGHADAAKEAYEKTIAEAKKKLDEALKDCKLQTEDAKAAYDTEIEQIKADEQDYTRRKENAEKWLADYEKNNPEHTDTSETIKQFEEYNVKVAKVQKYKAIKADADKYARYADEMNDNINKALDQRAEVVRRAKLPIQGLSFDENGLTLNGVQFAPGCVSDSQIMEVAAKLIIASNPKVKVFRIARGESLGAKRLQSIIDIAKKNGYQGFIEEVKRGQEDLEIEEYTTHTILS